MDKPILSTKEWQRLAPIAMLYFLIAFIRVLISNFIYMIPGLLVGYNTVVKNPDIWLPVIIIVVVFIIVTTILKFYFFQYRLSNDSIEIRSGILHKSHINLPFSRIQNIKLEQPVFFRPFDYTCLQLDTAGSIKQEAKIVALKVSFAEELKKEILSTVKNSDHQSELNSLSDGVSISGAAKENTQAEEVVINTRSLSDLVIHGLSSNRVWIFLGGFMVFSDNIFSKLGAWLSNIGIDTEQLLSVTDKPWWQIGFFVLSLTIIFLLIISFFSVLGSIISFYGYTLSKLEDRYIRRSGLFTRHEVSMKLSRLQMIVRQQDWLDLVLKRINLKFEQSSANANPMQAGALNTKIIVPSVKPLECQALIDDTYPENQMATIEYSSISARFLLRYIGYTLLPIFLIVCGVAWFSNTLMMILWALPVMIVLSGLVYLRWRRWGYYRDKNFFYVRRGIIGVDYICFPIYKVQQTQFKQSIFQKRRGLSTVRFILASGLVEIPYIQEIAAYDFINQSLYDVESSELSWM